jgi:polyhydroxybutyrate depolymerase
MRKLWKILLYGFVAIAILTIAVVLAVVIAIPVSLPGHTEDSFESGGRTRSYLLHVPPSYNGTRPVPLVVVLHAGGDHASHLASVTGMSVKADKEGFIAVYPNGTGRTKSRFLSWNSGSGSSYAVRNKVDDVGFIRTLIERLQNRFQIDANRIFIAGLSNGGKLAYRLACELPNVSAIAVVATPFLEECRPSRPVPVLGLHGTTDRLVPIEGGKSTRRVFYLFESANETKSAAEAFAFWAKHNGCLVNSPSEASSSVTRQECIDGTARADVVFYTLKGAGHVWPGGPRLWRFADAPFPDFSATDAIWEFFARR